MAAEEAGLEVLPSGAEFRDVAFVSPWRHWRDCERHRYVYMRGECNRNGCRLQLAVQLQEPPPAGEGDEGTGADAEMTPPCPAEEGLGAPALPPTLVDRFKAYMTAKGAKVVQRAPELFLLKFPAQPAMFECEEVWLPGCPLVASFEVTNRDEGLLLDRATRTILYATERPRDALVAASKANPNETLLGIPEMQQCLEELNGVCKALTGVAMVHGRWVEVTKAGWNTMKVLLAPAADLQALPQRQLMRELRARVCDLLQLHPAEVDVVAEYAHPGDASTRFIQLRVANLRRCGKEVDPFLKDLAGTAPPYLTTRPIEVYPEKVWYDCKLRRICLAADLPTASVGLNKWPRPEDIAADVCAMHAELARCFRYPAKALVRVTQELAACGARGEVRWKGRELLRELIEGTAESAQSDRSPLIKGWLFGRQEGPAKPPPKGNKAAAAPPPPPSKGNKAVVVPPPPSAKAPAPVAAAPPPGDAPPDYPTPEALQAMQAQQLARLPPPPATIKELVKELAKHRYVPDASPAPPAQQPRKAAAAPVRLTGLKRERESDPLGPLAPMRRQALAQQAPPPPARPPPEAPPVRAWYVDQLAKLTDCKKSLINMMVDAALPHSERARDIVAAWEQRVRAERAPRVLLAQWYLLDALIKTAFPNGRDNPFLVAVREKIVVLAQDYMPHTLDAAMLPACQQLVSTWDGTLDSALVQRISATLNRWGRHTI